MAVGIWARAPAAAASIAPATAARRIRECRTNEKYGIFESEDRIRYGFATVPVYRKGNFLTKPKRIARVVSAAEKHPIQIIRRDTMTIFGTNGPQRSIGTGAPRATK